MSHLAEAGQPWIVLPQEKAPSDEALWVAHLLAAGGDPAPQLERARALLSALGGLSGLLSANPEQLAAVDLLERREVPLLAAVQQIVSSAGGRPVIGSFHALKRFLRGQVVGEGVAVTRALLLGEQHRLQADVILARGGGLLSKDQRQELIRLCLEHRAFAVILARSVHRAESAMLESAREASLVAGSLEMLEMRLLDYVLVGPSEILRVPWCRAAAATSLAS
jgi:DNA repair protein RadC